MHTRTHEINFKMRQYFIYKKATELLLFFVSKNFEHFDLYLIKFWIICHDYKKNILH